MANMIAYIEEKCPASLIVREPFGGYDRNYVYCLNHEEYKNYAYCIDCLCRKKNGKNKK